MIQLHQISSLEQWVFKKENYSAIIVLKKDSLLIFNAFIIESNTGQILGKINYNNGNITLNISPNQDLDIFIEEIINEVCNEYCK